VPAKTKTIMNDLQQQIITELKYYHRGKRNGITFKKLALKFDVGSRKLRKTVSDLVNYGEAFIGSSSKYGYFYIDNPDEKMECYRELRKKGLAELFRARRLLRNDVIEKQPEKYEQQELVRC
jgi:hypothetical protein